MAKVSPVRVSVQKRFTPRVAETPELRMSGWSPGVVLAVTLPATVTLEKIRLTGVKLAASPISNRLVRTEPVATDFWRFPTTWPMVRLTAAAVPRITLFVVVMIRPSVNVRVPFTVRLVRLNSAPFGSFNSTFP